MFNIDPHGTVDYNGIKVPTILCHYDSYKLGLGSNHGDIDHWFPKFGKSMATVREDVAELMGEKKPEVTVPAKPVVNSSHKKGDEVKLVQGATYISGKAIPGWLFNMKLYVREIRSNGDIVFSTLATGAVTGVTNPANLVPYAEQAEAPKPVEKPVEKTGYDMGEEVKLTSKATYSGGKAIPTWVFKKKLYIRSEERSNGDYIISTLPTGAITGVVNKQYLLPYDAFEPYRVYVNVSVLNVRNQPNLTSSKVVAQIKRDSAHTILEVKGEWGRIESGWIYLAHTKKL